MLALSFSALFYYRKRGRERKRTSKRKLVYIVRQEVRMRKKMNGDSHAQRMCRLPVLRSARDPQARPNMPRRICRKNREISRAISRNENAGVKSISERGTARCPGRPRESPLRVGFIECCTPFPIASSPSGFLLSFPLRSRTHVSRITIDL